MISGATSTRLRRQQLQERFHVALLRPAHVADGIIQPLFLVKRIVAARPATAGESEIEFLAIKQIARHFHARHADHDDAPAVAANFCSQHDRFVRFRGSRDDDRVHAETVRQPRRDSLHLIARDNGDFVAAATLGQFARRLTHVDAEHAAARRFRNLHRQLPDQSQTDDRDSFAEARFRLTDALHGD